MVRSLLLCVVALSCAACRQGPKKCVYDTGCYPTDYCFDGFCVPRDGGAGGAGGGTAGGAGGGGGSAGGGGGTGGGSGGGTASCSPSCAGFEECVGSVCLPRFSALAWVSPLEGARRNAADGGLSVSAQLDVAAGRTASYPTALTLGMRAPAGATSSGLLNHTGGGAYQGVVPLGSGVAEGTYQLGLEGYGGLDAGVRSFVLDRTGPSVSTAIEPPPVRVNDGGHFESDPFYTPPQSPFRRDETLDLAVSYGASDVPDGGIVVTLFGPTAGGFGAAPTSAISEVTTGCRAACGTGTCRCFRAELWRVPFEAGRGSVTVQAEVTDEAGNGSGSMDAGAVQVTRWKWMRVVAFGPVESPPAIGRDGHLYFGEPGVVSVTRDGIPRWAAPASTAGNAVAVGIADGGNEVVMYFGGSTDFGAVSAVDGGSVISCSDFSSGADQSSPAFLWHTADMTPALTGVGARLGAFGGLSVVRPFTSQVCDPVVLGSQSVGTSNTVVVESTVIANTGAAGGLVAWRPNGSSWATTTAPSFGMDVRGVAIDRAQGELLVHGTNVGSAPLDGGSGQLLHSSGNIWGPLAVSAPGVWWAGSDVGGGALHRFGPGTTAASIGLTAPLATGPIIGAGGIVYLASNDGNVEAISTSNLTRRWRLGLGTAVSASPALDVARDSSGAKNCAKPGVLYVPANSGWLYALIVDSPGIEPNAPWPKFQHDPRNSGNADWSLSEFSCP